MLPKRERKPTPALPHPGTPHYAHTPLIPSPSTPEPELLLHPNPSFLFPSCIDFPDSCSNSNPPPPSFSPLSYIRCLIPSRLIRLLSPSPLPSFPAPFRVLASFPHPVPTLRLPPHPSLPRTTPKPAPSPFTNNPHPSCDISF